MSGLHATPEPDFDDKASEFDEQPPKLQGKPRATPLKGRLTEFYGFIGFAIFAFDRPVGSSIIENAGSCADALDDLAAQNPAVKKVLEALCQTTAIGNVIAAHMPIMLTVLMTHGSEDMKIRVQTMMAMQMNMQNEEAA